MRYVCKRTWVPHDHALLESFWRGGLRECRVLMGGGGDEFQAERRLRVRARRSRVKNMGGDG
jgi:hypothetical protein